MLNTGIISSRRALRKTVLPQSKNHHSNRDSDPTILCSTPDLNSPPLLINFDPGSIEYAPSIRCDYRLESTAESSHYLGLGTYDMCLTRCHSVSQPLSKNLRNQVPRCCIYSTAPTVRPRRHPFARIMASHCDGRLDNLTEKNRYEKQKVAHSAEKACVQTHRPRLDIGAYSRWCCKTVRPPRALFL